MLILNWPQNVAVNIPMLLMLFLRAFTVAALGIFIFYIKLCKYPFPFFSIFSSLSLVMSCICDFYNWILLCKEWNLVCVVFSSSLYGYSCPSEKAESTILCCCSKSALLGILQAKIKVMLMVKMPFLQRVYKFCSWTRRWGALACKLIF